MQYFAFTFAAMALFGLANSKPILYEAATEAQAAGVDPIPAKFGSLYSNDIDTVYSIYSSNLQVLAQQIQGRASPQRTSSSDDLYAAYHTAQTSFAAFKTVAKPSTTLCAALRITSASDQQTAVKYVAFVQHTAQQAYEHSISGEGDSACWDFCLIDDYMAAMNSYIKGSGIYNGRSIGTY